MLLDSEIALHVAQVYKDFGGSDAWFKMSIADLLPPRYKDQADKLVKGTQVFDVWFDNAYISILWIGKICSIKSYNALTWNFVLNENDFHENNQVTMEV